MIRNQGNPPPPPVVNENTQQPLIRFDHLQSDLQKKRANNKILSMRISNGKFPFKRLLCFLALRKYTFMFRPLGNMFAC